MKQPLYFPNALKQLNEGHLSPFLEYFLKQSGKMKLAKKDTLDEVRGLVSSNGDQRFSSLFKKSKLFYIGNGVELTTQNPKFHQIVAPYIKLLKKTADQKVHLPFENCYFEIEAAHIFGTDAHKVTGTRLGIFLREPSLEDATRLHKFQYDDWQVEKLMRAIVVNIFLLFPEKDMFPMCLTPIPSLVYCDSNFELYPHRKILPSRDGKIDDFLAHAGTLITGIDHAGSKRQFDDFHAIAISCVYLFLYLSFARGKSKLAGREPDSYTSEYTFTTPDMSWEDRYKVVSFSSMKHVKQAGDGYVQQIRKSPIAHPRVKHSRTYRRGTPEEYTIIIEATNVVPWNRAPNAKGEMIHDYVDHSTFSAAEGQPELKEIFSTARTESGNRKQLTTGI